MTISSPWVKLILLMAAFLAINTLSNRFFTQFLDDSFNVMIAGKWLLAAALLIFVWFSKKRREIGLVWENDWRTLWLYLPIAILVGLTFLAGSATIEPVTLTKITLFAIAVGITEEIIFRGYFFHWLRNLTMPATVLISSLAFGSAHLMGFTVGFPAEVVLAQVFLAAGTGVVFGVAKARHYGLFLPITVHAVFDICVLVSQGGYQEMTGEGDPALVVQGLLVGGAIVWLGGLIGLYFVNRQLKTADRAQKK